MAVNNKYFILISCFWQIYLHILFTASVNGVVYYGNNKYSKRSPLSQVFIGDLENRNNFKPELNDFTKNKQVNSLYNHYNDYAKSKRYKKNAQSEIIKNRVIFNGTEKSTQAYIHWIGKDNSERILVLTCKYDYRNSRIETSQLWSSDDYGSSFKEIKFEPGAQISFIYPFPANPKKLIFTDVVAKKLYVTDDELVTNRSISVEVEPDYIAPHPLDENKFLLYSITQRKLYVSINFGLNITLLAEDVLPNFFWSEPTYNQSADFVHMEIEGEMPSQAYYKLCEVPDCKVPPGQLGDLGPFLAGSLTVHKDYIFVQKSSWNGSDNYLAVSYQRKPFKRAFFPGDVITNDFILLNLDNNQVFVAVNHGDYVHLYLSDVTGQFYTLSLENVSHSIGLHWFEIDFYEVKSMPWTFIVNKRIGTPSKSATQTYISYDKGGNWAPLMVNQTCTFARDCGLQLQFIQINYFNSIFSEKNATGVIIGHGFIGTSSASLPPYVFTSDSGGANWTQVFVDEKPLTGIYQFNLLDQGSVITAVPDGLLTGSNSTVIYYSLDQGHTWQSEQFDEQSLIVKGVLTEPGITTMVLSIFGHELKEKPWTLIKLNFTNLLPKKCEDQDYISWEPKDYNAVNMSSCLLGSVIHYKRRRDPLKQCYNGNLLQTTKENIACNCTSEDYECDFGYEGTNGVCTKSKWFNDNYVPSECEVNDTYSETNGYRKIPSDICVEDSKNMKYTLKIQNCPLVAPSKLSVISEAFNIQVGKEVTFHLEQAGGSTKNTTYTWNYGDASQPEIKIGFKNASKVKHAYKKTGHFVILVTAENKKGNASAVAQVHVQESINKMYIVAPWAGILKQRITFTTVVASVTHFVDTNNDHLHFVWTFGDEPSRSLPTLTWNSTVSHVYNTTGLYKISVEAVNSVTSFYKELFVQIFDSAGILLLRFSENVALYNLSKPLIGQIFTQRIRQQLAEDTGVNMNRMEALLVSQDPVTVYLYIFQSADDNELNITQVKYFLIEKVKKGLLGVNIFGKAFNIDNTIQIVSATEIITDEINQNSQTEMNLKALFIAAPILVLALIVSGVSFYYCRKKMSNTRQFNLLNNHDDSDALLDDDDAPLDLNADFGIGDGSHDDPIIDNSGGNHLVLVTGLTDNAVNC